MSDLLIVIVGDILSPTAFELLIPLLITTQGVSLAHSQLLSASEFVVNINARKMKSLIIPNYNMKMLQSQLIIVPLDHVSLG